ncbi:hypothetical protein E2562_004957 [Oryza meyeriana var. granulata]|uniref:Uncharacterized protein n=1 Tax=Oryza meyeriana var. granulata TaxID=110450 RepID=A0A6G1C4S4_9ORYZ|nr:hypothetical protein E2562_004957 [Oryza meyeriana var. granulata]
MPLPATASIPNLLIASSLPPPPLGVKMALEISMEGIEARAQELGVVLSTVDLDSITLPTGKDFGIPR